MKSIIKNITICFSLASLLLIGACKKDFLDVNTNPTTPRQVDVSFALPSAQAYLGYTMGNQLSLAGGFWGQYWTQGPNANQYAALDQYVYNSSESDRPWAALYAGTLKDLQFIYETAQKDSTKKNYGAIARILQAYTYQVVTDAWGKAPFTEALKGDQDNFAPHYDSEEQIYDGILSMVNEGLGMLDDGYATPGSDDLIYNGDLFLWYEFGNTLKLKILMRQSEIRPAIAQQGISEMFTNGEPFLTIGEDARLSYSDQKFQQSPLFTTAQALGTNSNIFGSATLIDYMNATADPRADDYFDPNGAGVIAGLQQGSGKLLGPNQSDGSWSKPSEQIMGPLSFTYLLSASESYFLQAEAIARGYASGDDQAAYESGIEASWSIWSNASGADLPTFLASDSIVYPAAGSLTEKLRAILTQKWVALAGSENFEGWTEWRRTGIPVFQTSASTALGPGVFPARLVYPSDEVTSNTNFPGLKQVQDHVWWDVN